MKTILESDPSKTHSFDNMTELYSLDVENGKWFIPSEKMPKNCQQILMKLDNNVAIVVGRFLDYGANSMSEKTKSLIEKKWGTLDNYWRLNPRFTISGDDLSLWEHTVYWFGIPDAPDEAFENSSTCLC